MLINNKTYINFDQVYSVAAKPVVFKASEAIEESSYSVRKFIAAGLLSLFVGASALQAGFILNANAEGNPITSPVSAPITSEESPSPSPSQNPVTSPEVRPTVKILSPNGGETFNNGDSVRITFEQTGANACLLDYTYNGVLSSKFTAVNLANNYQDWKIEIDNMAPGSSVQAKVRATCYGPLGHHGAQDESDAFFTVNNPAPVTAPEVNPTPAPTSQPNNGGGNNGGGNSGGNGGGGSSSNNSGGGAPSCNNEAPKAPRILSAVTTGKNQITLNWEKPLGNVTHYGISYGLIKGKSLYGIANTGNVTSYTIKGLVAGVTYHFKVNGVNDCTAGESSSEIAVKVGGKYVAPAAPAPVVNGAAVKNTVSKFVSNLIPTKFTPVPSATPVANNNSQQANSGLLGKVVSLFKGWF